MRPLPVDLGALRAGGKAALAGCLSALETPGNAALLDLLDQAFATPQGVVLGLTGPPGVGKSTLANGFVARLRARGETAAVIAVDPSSRRSGGALLGDRTRISTDPGDAGAFVRSMAARRRLGGVADLTYPAAVLMRALFDWVFIETVGVGQSEAEIADCADLVILCVQPGAGDALQFMKAGVTEVPDILLVTKADLGAPAERAAADARGALSLAGEGPVAEVTLVSAETSAGIDEALALIAARVAARGDLAARRREQGRTWAMSQLLESFGTVGLAALGPRPGLPGSPFRSLASLSEAAGRAVHESLKNI